MHMLENMLSDSNWAHKDKYCIKLSRLGKSTVIANRLVDTSLLEEEGWSKGYQA
jgi:hypothetical protein